MSLLLIPLAAVVFGGQRVDSHGRTSAPSSRQLALAEALAVIQSKQFVDLTPAFEPGIPHWPGFPDEKRETLYWYDEGVGTKGKGFFAQQFTHVSQWGTHCDPPAHFVKGKRTIDQIELLANLDKVPETGAIVVVTFPKPKGGSGFPARVFAILP